MERGAAIKLLSYVPLGTLISVFDSPDQRNPLLGPYAGLGLSDGADTIQVQTRAGRPVREGTAAVKLDDAIAIVIDLK